MILIDVCIPAVDTSFDFLLDENIPIGQIIVEVSEMIAKKVGESRPENIEKLMLCSMDKQIILEREKTLYSCGITDGSSLMLV